ncbi:unnamed protein product [Candidula unifasciata]|uniref:G-protein coupled receptors family 1 profile domain-containing protein n=1 Tax=Candidula unifasciata TaxID=100452 RepID=A0A8S3ZH50_9EUPU|nr:unnamed protein product [Candidula unifasciata]
MARQPDMSLQWDSQYLMANGTVLYDDLHQLLLMFGGHSGPRSEMEEDREKLLYYLIGIGGSIVCCLGTIANAVSIAVLTRRSMRSSTYTYLAALAACDSLVLFLTLLIIINDTQHPDSPKQTDQFHAILFPFVHPTAVVFQVTSIWLTLAFTVDRYIMICHPFKAERMCRRSRARRVIISIYIMGVAFNIPRFLEYRTIIDTLPVTPNSSQVITVYGIHTTPLGNSVLFRELIHSWLYLLFICGIPFLTLVILNAFLIRAVHLSRLKGKEINPREKHRNDTTIMLIGVIVIFLFCQGPALVSRMIYAFQPASESTTAGFTLNEVGNFLVLLNSAINIVPYYLFGRKFRLEFLRIFCSCTLDKDDARRMSRNYSVSFDHRRLSQYNAIEMNGVAQNNCNYQNTVVSVETINTSQPHVDTFPDQKRQETFNGKTYSIAHRDSADTVVAPLIHQTCSIFSNRLANAGASRESLRNISSHSLSSPDTCCPQTAPLKPGGHVHYVTAGSCLGDGDVSAV